MDSPPELLSALLVHFCARGWRAGWEDDADRWIVWLRYPQRGYWRLWLDCHGTLFLVRDGRAPVVWKVARLQEPGFDLVRDIELWLEA